MSFSASRVFHIHPHPGIMATKTRVTFAGLKRKLKDLAEYMEKLESRLDAKLPEPEPPVVSESEAPTLSPHDAQVLSDLRAATEKGKAMADVNKPTGKWEDGVKKRKCHYQWLPLDAFRDVSRCRVWSRQTYVNLDGVQYLIKRDGTVPGQVSLCSACTAECPSCSEFALRSEIRTHGVCYQCGQLRTQLAVLEDTTA